MLQDVSLKNITTDLILEAIVVIIVAFIILYLFNYFINELASKMKGKSKYNILTLIPIFRIILIVLLFIYIFTLFVNINSTNILAFIGASGFIIGFAFQDYISSIFAGIVSLYEMQYKPGDWIEVNGIYGEVISSSLRTIEIKTPDNTIVDIPQQLLWRTPFYNSNSGSREILCVVEFYLAPQHNSEHVRQLLYDVALTNPLLQIKQPIIVVVEEKSFYTIYKLKAYPIEAKEQFKFKSDLSIAGKNVLIENGFEMQNLNSVEYIKKKMPK